MATRRGRLGLVVAAVVTMASLFGARPAIAQQASRLLCESIDYQPKLCPQAGLTEAFVVQVLGGQCIAGQQWGWGPRGITVNKGCRAVFGYRTAYAGGGYPPPVSGGPGAAVQCSSMNYQPSRCRMDTSRGVSIGMITNQPCRQGQTWGWDGYGVWVTGNCRAWFRPGGGGYAGGGYPGSGYQGGGGIGSGAGVGNGAGWGGQTISCSSWNYRPARCQANTRNGITLLSVTGGECIRNRSWGWDENGIWVNDGCRAVFQVN